MKNDYPKLPKAFKKKWISALRSGKFKQGKTKLKYKDEKGVTRHCCLGVACEIQGAKINMEHGGGFISSNRGVTGVLKVPIIIRGNLALADELSWMNDNGKTFKGIATWIDKNL